ncbi:MAG: hypothetical protein CMJ79_15285 [Planctomycetaceae bacterium]|jgi:hypothetical protein|nr:hypothetical protein [Planctomycetaceae bacterium]|tara:strand:- start:683 stop:1381 length:699 start_codon:yes stop_codon:yes gene_type:complete
MKQFITSISVILAVGLTTLPTLPILAVNEKVKPKLELQEIQEFIGQWKGVGQLKRGSTQGGWIEESLWEWKFAKQDSALIYKSPKGKFVKELRVSFEDGAYIASGVNADDEKIELRGRRDESGKLVFVNSGSAMPSRISFRTVASGKRMVVSFERKLSESLYTRLGEVGATRKGSMFGKGVQEVVCIVSGGKGTTPVTFEGKTYYVCCTGCRDYFNENAAEIVAEYAKNKNK